jgi:hypothetical protein
LRCQESIFAWDENSKIAATGVEKPMAKQAPYFQLFTEGRKHRAA